MMAAIMMRGCSVQQTPLRQPCCLAACLTCFQTSGVRNSRIEPESDSARLARRCARLADARAEEAEHFAAMGPSLLPWGFWEKPRHDDKRRSHVLGQFPQGRPTPSPYQTTTPSTSHPNSSSALGDPAAAGDLRLGHRAPGRGGREASIPLPALTTLLSALRAFCLWEPSVARICPGNLRYICSDNGNASQGADNTSVRAGGVLFCLCELRVSQQISTFYGPSVQARKTWLGARQRRRPPMVHRSSAPTPMPPAASGQ